MGIDVGSSVTKGVLLSDGNIVSTFMLPTGTELSITAEECIEGLLKDRGLTKKDVLYTVSTGYGRTQVVDEFIGNKGTCINARFLFAICRPQIVCKRPDCSDPVLGGASFFHTLNHQAGYIVNPLLSRKGSDYLDAPGFACYFSR
jgi:hypothetical protein